LSLPDILTLEQVAAYLQVEVDTLYSATRTRALRPLKTIRVGKSLRVRRETLLAWLAAGEA
jgi:excisionase family DNA binding protein